jgi:Flp pilus assembly protein TadD
LFFLSWTIPAQRGPRYALVIGNADYRYINKLTNTVKDARDLTAVLGRLGFQVDLRLDLTDSQFTEAVRAYTAKLASNPQSEGFFWFTGHGVQMAGENYMLPVDITAESAGDLRRNSVSLNQLLGELESTRNKVNILVVDACRTNPFPAVTRDVRSGGLAAIRDVPGDLVVMFSTAPDKMASDGPPGKNSPFAEAFLKYVESPEPVNMMVPDVVRETMIITEGEQRPFINGSVISDKYYSLNPARTGAGNGSSGSAEAAVFEETAEGIHKTGIALFAKGEFDRAVDAFTRAIKLKPDYGEAFYYRGLVYYEKKEPGRAMDDFNEAVRLDGSYAAAYFNRGIIYGDRKEYGRAMAEYNETIRLNPGHAKARNNRGNLFVLSKEYDKAIADFTEAIGLNPASAVAYHNRGSVYRIMGNQRQAASDFAEAGRLGWKE